MRNILIFLKQHVKQTTENNEYFFFLNKVMELIVKAKNSKQEEGLNMLYLEGLRNTYD